MTDTGDDPLNMVIYNTRNRLRELQKSIGAENTDYSTLVSEIKDLSTTLKQESEVISAIPPQTSDVIPLFRPTITTARKKEKQNVPPLDDVRYKVTKAAVLKKQYTVIKKDTKKLPTLKGNAKFQDASTLIAKGILSPSDDLSNLLPTVEPSSGPTGSLLFPNIHVDIGAAAREIQRKKALKTQRRQITTPTAILTTPRINDLPEEVIEKPAEEPPKPRIYEDLQDEFAYQTLLVVHGKIARETPDFESFQRTNTSRWERINQILLKIEEICAIFKLSYAEIDGRKLSQASFSKQLDMDVALGCLLNIEEYVNKIRNQAATLIQRNFRLFLERRECNNRKTLFHAALTIQNFWRNQKSKEIFLNEIRNNIEEIPNRAMDLTNNMSGKFKDIEKDPYVEVHVITNPIDFLRVMDLMFTNITLILIVHYLPQSHIWEDFLEYMAHCGIPNVNERINFVILKETYGGNGISNRLFLDMVSVNYVKKLLFGRTSFLVPHSDWDIERQLSLDLNIPIFGSIKPEEIESRTETTSVFRKSGIVTPLSTKEYFDIEELGNEVIELMRSNTDLTRWIIHLGCNQSEDAIAWFESNRDILYSPDSFEEKMKRSISATTKPQIFLQKISMYGATVEAVPNIVYSFPSVSLLLTGNEIRVIGTYDRMHHSPFRFGALVAPSVSINGIELVSMGRAVGSELMKRNIIGYVTVDFMTFQDKNIMRTIGFGIRLNSYPAALQLAYCTLSAGYNEQKNKIVLLRNNGQEQIKGKKSRYVIIHTGLTHNALNDFGSKDIKRNCFNHGFMFDLLNRTGFKLQFLDAPPEGKSFSMVSATSVDAAIALFEKSYEFIVRMLSQKCPSDENSISRALISARHFHSRVLK
ncbi:IQ calmodulin-binding motif family protein [Trichomonas vaginalis G3]|uniref:IQ calmodulin-binding motif family protein n=1 Tax=Trichomonas vaginalis (strain ATCC PRA-98 / G3) TaxID=412133 RepID=A2DYS5_TRIV3|nr:IQ domain-containing protein H family [Trichomonas vaginalis G3]EAY14465.1 IQ calmodulin-binding motif family protein [Trichomonas vaginalis G3]KAI5519645.1 IQ domain-containing protein H family [Trichomonas vaginalis G3]|eukprot:XP_001326688.1 IQ calmodulin-binding motif family protein [Trichomonas vaginalis G3]